MALLHPSLKADPNLTPMLDMVFQLVTFFMLVINFKSASLDLTLQLPVVGSALPTESGERDVLILNVLRDGKVRVYGESRDAERYIADEAKNIGQNLRGKSPSGSKSNAELPPTVILRADRTTPYHLIHRIIQACQMYGFRNFQYRALNPGV